MKLRYSLFSLILGLFLTVAVATGLAQDETCPELVARALQAVSLACGDLSRNTVCYGNNHLEATFDSAVQVTFDQPADRAPVEALQSLHTFPLDETLGLWGVALLNIQANLPETLPGQGVKFILYGDVMLQNATPNENSDTAPFAPMQAFYLTTTPIKTTCHEAPPDSLVIQSPQGYKVNLNANGMDVTIGSTVAFRAQPNQRMSLTTLQGEAVTEFNGETRTIPAGFEVNVPLGGEDGLTVEGAPEDFRLIDDEEWEELADASGEIWEESVEMVDTDAWDSAEDYCADPANADVCAEPSFVESLADCDESGCFQDENIPVEDCGEDCPVSVDETACGDDNCDAGDDRSALDQPSSDDTVIEEPPPEDSAPAEEPPSDSPPDDSGGGDEGGD
jgi:hypothetical protein